AHRRRPAIGQAVGRQIGPVRRLEPTGARRVPTAPLRAPSAERAGRRSPDTAHWNKVAGTCSGLRSVEVQLVVPAAGNILPLGGVLGPPLGDDQGFAVLG